MSAMTVTDGSCDSGVAVCRSIGHFEVGGLADDGLRCVVIGQNKRPLCDCMRSFIPALSSSRSGGPLPIGLVSSCSGEGD